MRQTISGLVAAVAVMMTAGAAPAMACGGGLLQSSCSPCASYSSCAPAPVYVAPVASYGCGGGCGGWTSQRLADPEQQYYYVNQGPTYTGPGSYAPAPVYREDRVSHYTDYRPRSYGYGYRSARYYDDGPAIYRAKRHFHSYRGYTGYRYSVRPSVRYGYAPRYHGYAPRYSLPPRVYGGHHGMRYGAPVMAPRFHHHRERVLRRYF